MKIDKIALTADDMHLKKMIDDCIEASKKSWEDNNNSRGLIPDNSEFYQEDAEKHLKTLENTSRAWNNSIKNIVNLWLDFGVGLYPTFEIDYINQDDELIHHTEYISDNFFKFINGFWN